MSTRVYLLDVTPLQDEVLFLKAYASIKKQRQEKIDSYRFEKDKCLSLGVELLIKYLLSKNGYSYYENDIQYHENKKPYFDLDKFYFNASHSGKYVLLATSSKEVGVDIEECQEANLNVAKRYFTMEEYNRLVELDDNNNFYRLWTIKESLLKNLGVGLSVPLNTYSFALEFDKNEFNKQIEDEAFYFKIEDKIKGYIISISSLEEEIEPIKIINVNDLI